MGDISQKGLKRYSGQDLTIIWKSRRRLNVSGVCRKGLYHRFYHVRDVYNRDVRVYKNKPMRMPHRNAKLFVKRLKVFGGFEGEERNHWVLSMFDGSGYDLWLIQKRYRRVVRSRKCGGKMVETERYFRDGRQDGCIHVDCFLATIQNDNIYLRASVRMCTPGELMKYANKISRQSDKPFYRYQSYSTDIRKGSRQWWPTLHRVWKQGRLISKRVTWPKIWKP